MQGSRSVCRAANHHHDLRYFNCLKKSPSPPSVSTPGPPPQPLSPPGPGSCPQLLATSWLACLQVLGSGSPTAWALVGLLRRAAPPGARASGPSSAARLGSWPGWWAVAGSRGARAPPPPRPGSPSSLCGACSAPHPGGGRGALSRRGCGPAAVLVPLAGAPLRHLVGCQVLSVILSSNKGAFHAEVINPQDSKTL